MAKTVSGGRPNRRCRGHGGVLGTALMMVYARGERMQGCMGELVWAHGRAGKGARAGCTGAQARGWVRR